MSNFVDSERGGVDTEIHSPNDIEE